jgi:hypothetical protein
MPDSDEKMVPVAEVLRGLEVHPLEPGWTPMEALVLVKCLDEKGEDTWLFRTTHNLNLEELLGTLIVHADVLRQKLSSDWIDG